MSRHSGSELTIRYIELVQERLNIVTPPLGPPLFDTANDKTLEALGEDLRDLLRESGKGAIDFVRAEGSRGVLQTVAYGAFDDLDLATKIGFLLGERVVLWDILASRLLDDRNGTYNVDLIGAVANSLVALSPLARKGHIVILPHPSTWHDGALSACKRLALDHLATPKLIGLVSTFAVANELGLHPYTVVETQEEYDQLRGSARAAAADDSDQLFRTTVAALSATQILEDERFVELLGVSTETFHDTVANRASFYAAFRDRVVGDTFSNTQHRIKAMANELATCLESINTDVRDSLGRASSGASVIAGTISLLLSLGGPSVPAKIAAALALAASTGRLLDGKKPQKAPVVHAVFQELKLAQAVAEYRRQRTVESRHYYLKALTPGLAHDVLEEMTEADIERTVNVRPTWHDYCAEFLGELWWMNIDAFWRHAEVAFRHPEEGMVVGDTDDHWDALKSAPMPQYVWKACLESILATSLVLPELLEETVVAQLDWGGEHGESMRDELVAWVRSLTNERKQRALAFLKRAFEGTLPAWLADGIGQ
jgi:hypothetical protein